MLPVRSYSLYTHSSRADHHGNHPLYTFPACSSASISTRFSLDAFRGPRREEVLKQTLLLYGAINNYTEHTHTTSVEARARTDGLSPVLLVNCYTTTTTHTSHMFGCHWHTHHTQPVSIAHVCLAHAHPLPC